MIVPAQYVWDEVILPVVRTLTYPNPKQAGQLLLGTAAHESGGFVYIHQVHGPARSIFQIEPATATTLIDYISHNSTTQKSIQSLSDSPPNLWMDHYQFNHILAACLARVYYYRVKEPLPAVDNLFAQASYWKKYYNTELGRGTIPQYLASCDKYLNGVSYA